MKNRLTAFAAGTALSAIMAGTAAAGYTIYEDSALPSVLFVEFDASGVEPTVISAPAGAPAPVVITGPGSGVDTGSDASGDSAPAADDMPAPRERSESRSLSDEIDLEPTPENLVEDAMRRELFPDADLR